jgi:hypothetical protein
MITFGRFGHKKDKEKDQKLFLEYLNGLLDDFINFLNPNAIPSNLSEKELITPLKKIIKRKSSNKSFYEMCLTSFLERMGLSYYTLTQKEKEEIIDMDFTYANWEKKSLELFESFIERSKNVCPREVWFCFDDICFIIHVETVQRCEFTSNNFLIFIRDYFIINYGTNILMEYRDEEKFKEIQRKVFEVYPIIRERNGTLLYKFKNYFQGNSDYDFEISRNLLNNYYNKNNKIKDDETINLKDKLD